jgi:hypothetical protein
MTIPTFLVPFLLRSPIHKLPPGLVLGGGVAITAGGILAFLAVGANSSWTVLILGMILAGIGIGIANPAIARVGLGVVPPERSGMASGLSNTFRIGGLATGVAALGAVFQQRITSSMSSTVGSHAGTIGRVISSAGVKAAAHGNPKIADAARVAFASGLRTIVVIGAIIVVLGAVAAALLVRSKDFHSATAPASSPASASPVAAENS